MYSNLVNFVFKAFRLFSVKIAKLQPVYTKLRNTAIPDKKACPLQTMKLMQGLAGMQHHMEGYLNYRQLMLATPGVPKSPVLYDEVLSHQLAPSWASSAS